MKHKILHKKDWRILTMVRDQQEQPNNLDITKRYDMALYCLQSVYDTPSILEQNILRCIAYAIAISYSPITEKTRQPITEVAAFES